MDGKSLPFSYSPWFGDLSMVRGNSYERIVALLEALDRGEGYEEYLDVDEVLRFFACTAAYDGRDSLITELRNYFLYDTGEKFVLIPWDLSEAFTAVKTQNGIDNFQINIWETSQPSLLFDLLMRDEDNRERYHAYLREILDNFLAPEKMEPYFQSLAALIAPFLARDHTIFLNHPFEIPVVSEEGFGTLGSLLSTLSHTYDNLSKQLQGSEHVFYVNPAINDFPSMIELDRLVSFLLKDSPTVDPNITDTICENYSKYRRKTGLFHFSEMGMLTTVASFAVFLSVFGAVTIIARRQTNKNRPKKRASDSDAGGTDT